MAWCHTRPGAPESQYSWYFTPTLTSRELQIFFTTSFCVGARSVLMADVTTEAAADDEDGVNSPNTQKRLDFAAALKKDAPSPGVARRIIEGADGGVRIARVVPACPRKSPRQTSPPPRRAQDGGEHTPKTRRRIANMLVERTSGGKGGEGYGGAHLVIYRGGDARGRGDGGRGARGGRG